MLHATVVEEYHADPDGMVLHIYDHLDGAVSHEEIASELDTAVKLSEAALSVSARRMRLLSWCERLRGAWWQAPAPVKR